MMSASTQGMPTNPRTPPNAPPAMSAKPTGMSRQGTQVMATPRARSQADLFFRLNLLSNATCHDRHIASKRLCGQLDCF